MDITKIITLMGILSIIYFLLGLVNVKKDNKEIINFDPKFWENNQNLFSENELKMYNAVKCSLNEKKYEIKTRSNDTGSHRITTLEINIFLPNEVVLWSYIDKDFGNFQFKHKSPAFSYQALPKSEFRYEPLVGVISEHFNKETSDNISKSKEDLLSLIQETNPNKTMLSQNSKEQTQCKQKTSSYLRKISKNKKTNNSNWNYNNVKYTDLHTNSDSIDYSGRYNGPDGQYRYNVEKWFASPANGFKGPS